MGNFRCLASSARLNKIEFMPNELMPANILDLTAQETLFELAIEPTELIGRTGAKLIADLKDRAVDAEYTHMYFRDPIRPGIIWFTMLEQVNNNLQLPTRGRLDHCRRVTDSVFPGFLAELENSDEEIVMSAIPPIASGVNGTDLATALEYLVFVYPGMVRAWAALIFTYDEMLGLKEGAEGARSECIGSCPHAQVVSYLLGDAGDTALEA